MVALVLATFFAGSVLACSGNYCTAPDLSDCVTLDSFRTDSCCLTLDSSGQRCWTCSREEYLCNDIWEVVPGPPLNPNSPGGACN